MIEFMGDGDVVPGYLARPGGAGPFPGVVVIQEWWGLNAHIKDVADRFAQAGYVALAPDLYRGQVAAEPDQARKLAMELEHSRAVKDIQGAVDYLVTQSDVEPKQVGIVGFCMGGGLSALMAFMGVNVGAVAVFYGRIAPLQAQIEQVSVPVLGLFGEADQGIQAAGRVSEFVIYPAAPHAFFNDTRPSSYHPEAAVDSWQRTLAWFGQYLTA